MDDPGMFVKDQDGMVEEIPRDPVAQALGKTGLHQLANGVWVDAFQEGDVLIDNEDCQLVITSVKETENGQEINAVSIPKKLNVEVRTE